jgi:adenylate cyclase, class 2
MRNLEAKFKLSDPKSARKSAAALGYELRGSFAQRDTFFVVPAGKLKLREQADGAWLIHYRRQPARGLELSDYEIVPVVEPAASRAILAAALGTLAEVRKERTLLMRGNVRLHLDRVEGLGEFGEIEAVIGPGESAASYRAAVDQLLRALAVRDAELIELSYFEMISRGQPR